ncbi:MAG: hypothetical protein A4E69_01883 [Syntrophus sp. PtaB.Bin138]|nr:MAG: hypothetical protein A4E69_01883 [Syntrophus sp. PtaB.Bin138]
MEEQTIIETQQETGLTPITDDTLISLAEQAEKRIDAMNKIKRVAIKLTNRHDWTDQGGKPYLQVSGAEKIARMFGISWRISEPIKETYDGGHFAFTYKGYFSLAGATIEAIGTRSSKDGFFKKYSGRGDDRVELPASEIDGGDVKKSAYTNCIGNGITRLLGIRNLTYEDLQEFAGITSDMIGRVDYKKKGKADAGIQEEAVKKVVSKISDVRKQTGRTKSGKDFTKYIIRNGNSEYSTLSESNARIAKKTMDSDLWAEIHYKSTQYGNDLTEICICDPPVGEPSDREAA